jgi:hypothetical protein
MMAAAATGEATEEATMTDATVDVLARTRTGLQQVAVHVLARRRHAVTGRFGLRPAPGGFATPMFGDADEVVRVSGTTLVVERGGDARVEELTTLGRAAEVVGVDLAADFSVGHETPPLADPAAPLGLDAAAAWVLGGWWVTGAGALDEAVAGAPAVATATVSQLWPEHFDHGCTVTLGRADDDAPRANLGASPGDGYEPEPYLYVGPWGPGRPGDPGYWNAPFGAVLRRAELAGLAHDDRRVRMVDFVRRGLGLLAGG